jgi:hypothetical protein
MVTKMILITLLIVSIFFATWVKDGVNMNPPLGRRAIIDITVVIALWILYLVFDMTKSEATSSIASTVIDIGLLYFVAQFIYLIGSISPLFKGLVNVLKKKGINVPEIETDDEKGE